MIPYIENYKNPQIGDFFMVRTVRFSRNDHIFIWPVFAESHTDSVYELPQEHYHIDWRFMPQDIVNEHRLFYRNLYKEWNNVIEAEYFEPIMKEVVLEEYYSSMKYLRDLSFPKGNEAIFQHLQKEMSDLGAKMKKMKCPHHGTNLLSCKPIDGVVTCPQHGLKWNIKTGELVI